MRLDYLLAAGLAMSAACNVPDKHPVEPDAGVPGDGSVDAPVDADAPDTKFDQVPDPFSHTSQATFRFSSNDATATFLCRVDMSQVQQKCTSPFVLTLADGPHSLSVRAVDPAGNSDDTPAEKAWTIDTQPPDTTLDAFPPPADNSVMVRFKFSSKEANVSFDCSLDSGGFVPCTSGAMFGPVGDGPHSFAVRARDRAGNVDASPAIYAWNVDTRTPDTEIDRAPDDATNVTTASFTFMSLDAGAGATFQCALDGAAFAPCTSPQVYSALAQGMHTFAVRVRDAVGNLDPSPATRSWLVDLTPPTTAITAGPANGSVIGVASASFTFASSEAGSSFKCTVDGGLPLDCMSPDALPTLGQGAHTFTVRATDAAGNPDPSAEMRSWTVDTVAPDISITAGPAAASVSGPRVSFGFTVSEGAVACSFDSGAFAACASPLAINLPAGPHQLSVRATDAANNVTIVTRAWTVACAAPDATGAAGQLHLDDTGQTLANAVTGGAPATLGDTTAVESGDPASLPGGRFGGALSFSSAESDHVAWPVALAAMPDLTIELWARPGAPAGTRDLAVSGDGRVALRVTAVSPTTVQFSISIVEGGTAGQTRVATSAAVAAGAWHHVLASLQQPTLRLWVDGTRTDAGSVQLATPLALDSLRLGGDAASAYEGALDEVWIAQTAITADEAALVRYCPL